jgi:hypothetical protein
MPSITRVEFSVGPSLRSNRAVLLIEFPDDVLQQIKKGKTSPEVEGYRVALDAIRALHLGSVRGEITFLSSTPGKIKRPESLGEPQLYRRRRLPRLDTLKRSLLTLDVVLARHASLLY